MSSARAAPIEARALDGLPARQIEDGIRRSSSRCHAEELAIVGIGHQRAIDRQRPPCDVARRIAERGIVSYNVREIEAGAWKKRGYAPTDHQGPDELVRLEPGPVARVAAHRRRHEHARVHPPQVSAQAVHGTPPRHEHDVPPPERGAG